MVCGPLPSVEVVHCAFFCPETSVTGAALQMTVEPSLKSTVPVGVVPTGGAGEPVGATVAVKVTDWPLLDVGDDESSVTCESKRSTVVLTVLVSSGLLTNAPESVPWLLTCGPPDRSAASRAGGLFKVTWKVIVTVLPTGSLNPAPPPLIVTTCPPAKAASRARGIAV